VTPLPVADLDYIAGAVDWSGLKGARILITGSRGFFGQWMVQSLNYAGVDAIATRWYRGDPAPSGDFTHVVHLARIGIVPVLEIAARTNAAVLYTSSGAVYEQTTQYASEKRIAEAACVGRNVKIVRPFCFVGPCCDERLSIMQFLLRGMAGKPLRVTGNQTRSYLYAADLAVWLWTILIKGNVDKPYDIGGNIALDLATLAVTVAGHFQPEPEVVLDIMGEPTQYLPDLTEALSLGLRQKYTIDEAITRTLTWLRSENA
jgi:nucleoside-diphosphate-sugar epimerase